MRAACRPDPVRIASIGCRSDLVECAPRSPGRPSHGRGPASARRRRAISRLRKPLTGVSASACPGAPRDWSRPPPRRASCPPRRGPACRRSALRRDRRSSISTRPVSAVSPSRRAITAMILCFTAQAVGCLTPRRRRFHRRDAVLRRHDQVDGCKPECQRQLGRVEDRARRGRCLLLAIDRAIRDPPARNARDGRSRGRRSRPASAAGAAPRGTAPRCRRPRETPRRSNHARAMQP